MKPTRMLGTAALTLVSLTVGFAHTEAGELLDRPHQRQLNGATSQPRPVRDEGNVAVSSAANALSRNESVPKVITNLTLEQALALAEANHPELVADAAAVDAAYGRFRQARSYPNPTIDVRGESLNETEIIAGVSQPVILGGRRQRAIQAASQNIEARQRDYDSARARVIWRVKQAFWEVVGMQQLLELARQQEHTAQVLVDKMRERLKQGDAAERDLLRAQLDHSSVRIQAENVARSLIEARKELAMRMGIAVTRVDHAEGELQLPPAIDSEDELIARLQAGHPELQAALAEIQFRDAVVAQAQAERVPDATVTMLARRLTDSDQNTADVGVTLPLPLFDRRQGRIQEAAAEASRARAQLARSENELLGRLRRTCESMVAYNRQARMYTTTVLPDTERTLNLVRVAYEGGDVSILELLDTQRQTNTAHAAYLELLLKLQLNWLEVEYLAAWSQSTAPR